LAEFPLKYSNQKLLRQCESELSFLELSCLPSLPFGMSLTEVMAANVRRARHVAKLTQEELAARAGVSARYLGSIERAEVSATVTVLERLAAALGVDPCALIRPQRQRRPRR
jgi:DNA-binding XRE family transcriptional regulator